MTNEEFIAAHRTDDVRTLALRGAPPGVDLTWCATQIEGWQLARRKLPSWAGTAGLHYPPRLSMEQCSSQDTALYKRSVVERLLPEAERTRLTDLTGGLGVDFWALAPLFREAVYVEKQPRLCQLARHNLPLLGLPRARIVNDDAPSPALWATPATTLFLDPARRDGAGRKTVAIPDCTPNLLDLQPHWQTCRMVVVKLSPMLDIAGALRLLRHVSQVHVVSVRGECRELLLVVQPGSGGDPLRQCASIDGQGNTCLYTCRADVRAQSQPATAPPHLPAGCMLFEPGPSLLKGDCQDAFACQHGMLKLHPMSHLFVAPQGPENDGATAGHGRWFVVDEQLDFGKASLRRVARLGKANLTLRNFPGTVDALRRRLRLTEGGDHYLFATTMSDGSHALLCTTKKRTNP